MQILSYIIGCILIIFWLISIKTGRKLAIAGILEGSGGVMPNTVFQLYILPFFTSVLLFLTGNIFYFILFLIIFFISRLSIILAYYFSFSLSALIGLLSFKTFGFDFKYYWIVGIIVGLLIGLFFCSVMLNYVTGEDIKKRINEKSKP